MQGKAPDFGLLEPSAGLPAHGLHTAARRSAIGLDDCAVRARNTVAFV
jgi:hypothetical protein